MKRLCTLFLMSHALLAQGWLNPAKLGAPPTDNWPTYNGDYSGRRYSTLAKINQTNINSLSLAWVYRANGMPGGQSGFSGGRISATPVQVNGVLYFTMPDHAWAVDARTGREVWHYAWTSHGGEHIGNRGVGVYGNWLYFEAFNFVNHRNLGNPNVGFSAGVNGLNNSSTFGLITSARDPRIMQLGMKLIF